MKEEVENTGRENKRLMEQLTKMNQRIETNFLRLKEDIEELKK